MVLVTGDDFRLVDVTLMLVADVVLHYCDVTIIHWRYFSLQFCDFTVILALHFGDFTLIFL
jgi:hypothetical protein